MKKLFLLFTILLTGAGCQNIKTPQYDEQGGILENSIPFLLENTTTNEPAKNVEVDVNDLSTVKTVDNFKVTLGSNNKKIKSGEETKVYFQIEAKNNAPIEHVDRYAGGHGRLTMQNVDTGEFIQANLPPKSLTEIYNRIPFNITFPAPGKYKLSFEFKYWGKAYSVPFVVEVGE